MQNVDILQIKKGNFMKYTTFCRGINWDCAASLKKYNEIYLLIKYIKSVLWRVAERLSYIQDAWSLKVNTAVSILGKNWVLYATWFRSEDRQKKWLTKPKNHHYAEGIKITC